MNRVLYIVNTENIAFTLLFISNVYDGVSTM